MAKDGEPERRTSSENLVGQIGGEQLSAFVIRLDSKDLEESSYVLVYGTHNICLQKMTVCAEMRPSVFWGIAQRLVLVTDVSAHLIGPILKSQAVEEENFMDSLTLEGRTYILSRNLSK
jgi:hypothetical protein